MSDHDPEGDESFMYPDRRDRPEVVVGPTRLIDNYTDAVGQNWDLNDPATYEGEAAGFPEDCRALDAHGLYKRITHEIGFSLYYMLCIHPDSKIWKSQYDRVLAFGRFFARESREADRRDNVPWLRKQLFLILDETENQC